MVKLAVLFTAGLVAFTGLATAKNCKDGLRYCGRGLLKKGNYYNDIVNELQQHGKPTDQTNVNDSLFNCGDKGAIGFVTYCSTGCVDGGKGHSDFCG